MKKALAILLMAAALAGTLAGCAGKEPAAESAMQLDMVQLLETAAKPGEETGNALRTRLGAPERVEKSMSAFDGKLTVAVAAEVVLPAASRVPVVRVEPAQFSQELVTTMFQRLTAGQTLYNRDINVYTKEQLQSQIDGIRSTYDNDFFYDDRDAYIEQSEQEIAQIEKRMKKAPDEVPMVVADGTLVPKTTYNPFTGEKIETHMGVLAQSDYGDGTPRGHVSFQVNNDNDLTEAYIVEYTDGEPTGGTQVGHGATLWYLNHTLWTPKTKSNYGAKQAVPIVDESAVPAEAHGGMQVTPLEARRELEEILEGTDLVISRIYLISANNYDEPVPKEDMDYAYSIQCVRRVKGVNCAMGDESSGASQDLSWEEIWAPYWSRESCTVWYGDGGIINFYWNGPMQLAETVVEDAKLLPFSTVMDVFDRMISVVNEDGCKRETLIQMRVEIDRIELCLRRVREKGDIESGLLIPVWAFYGQRLMQFPDGEGYTGGTTSPDCMLLVNAVDGSIVTGD